jgi:eukaryotic-like serine/threonine-protein kinase
VADLPVGLREALAGTYALQRELGRGGMATVYLAQDLKHDRPVALKVLHPDLAASLGPERFLREIKLAARLQHPHILAVLDSGEAGGRLWFTMPYVEGESLRDRLRRERQLPVEDAVRIAREAAQALQYAHDHDVLHRDIKPENLLLTRDGSTLVADFGIARALGANEDRLTETGLAVGTPAYMSPEQAAADRAIDARTDVYSLGAVLYEMLAGEPPYTGPTAQAMAAKRLTGPVPNVRSGRPNVPESLDQAIRRALAPIAADRFPSAAELGRALAATTGASAREPVPSPTVIAPSAAPPRPIHYRSAVLLGLGFLLGLGVLFGLLRRQAGAAGGADPSHAGAKLVAVLPFENVGGAEDEYFADGMTDEVRGKLASLDGLQVTARSSSNQYKKTTKSPQQIGHELGVDYLLTGTVRWDKGAAGSHVRVSPELIQVSSGATRWQQPFDASLTDVFTVQGELAGQVAQALGVAIGAAQQQALAERPTRSDAAYDAYLKGEAVFQSLGTPTPENLRTAISFYERAVALDSGFVLAWAQLSRAHSSLYYNGTPTPEGERRAREGAERAARLAPGHFAGHLALGDYYNSIPIRYDFPRALREYEAGLRSSPDNADLLAATALVEMRTGRWEDAVRHLIRARTLDPRSILVGRRLAFTYVRLRRYAEAMDAADHITEVDSASLPAILNKTMIRLGQGDLAGAQAMIRSAPPTVDPATLAAFFGNYYDLYWVLPSDLQGLLLRLTPSAYDGDRGIWGITRAETYHLRGDLDRARAYADSAREAFEAVLRSAPNEPQRRVFHGLALA